MPTFSHDTNRLRLLLTACLILLLVGAAMVATAAIVYDEDWEDGSSALDDYTESTTASGTVTVTNTRSHAGTFSLELEVDNSGGEGGERHAQVTYDNTFSVDLNNDVNMTGWMLYTQPSGSEQSSDISMELVDTSGDNIRVQWEQDASEWNLDGSLINASGTDDENTTAPSPGGSFTEVRIETDADDDTVFVYHNGTQILNAELLSTFSNPNDVKVRFRHGAVPAGAPYESNGFFDDITVDSSVPPVRNITLDANDYMRPNTTQYYNVVFNDDGTATDVSSSATVTSNNSTIVSVDATNDTLEATTDPNVAGTARINASFTDDDGETHNDSVNVTVAQATMKNFDILPSAWRINALFAWDMGTGDQASDTLPLIILISIFAGGITARVVSSFAGIGAMLLVIIVGWFGGWVGTGVVLSALFVGLFIGFNLAANIDYAVRR